MPVPKLKINIRLPSVFLYNIIRRIGLRKTWRRASQDINSLYTARRLVYILSTNASVANVVTCQNFVQHACLFVLSFDLYVAYVRLTITTQLHSAAL